MTAPHVVAEGGLVGQYRWVSPTGTQQITGRVNLWLAALFGAEVP